MGFLFKTNYKKQYIIFMLTFKFISQETRDKLNIRVINIDGHTPTDYDYYIGRPSVLSNPYTHKEKTKYAKFIVKNREMSISSYKTYFDLNLDTNEFKNEIDKLLNIHDKYKSINLICFCKPKSCHGDYIKKYLEDIILNKKEVKI